MQFRLACIGSAASDQFQFFGIGGDAGRSLVTGPVRAFGIHQNRDAAGPAKADESPAKIRGLKKAFSVVGQNHDITNRRFLLESGDDFLFQLRA